MIPLIVVLFSSILAAAAPKVDSWDRWKAHDPVSTLRFDHGKWQSFLDKYLDTASKDVNLVRYGQVSSKDKESLESYLADLQGAKVSQRSRNEQKAYWINLYNAMTVAVILRHYPAKSIREIDLSKGVFKKGPWDAGIMEVEGRRLTLNDIEHRILRPLWKDNRVHFGLNCASLSCPGLAPEAYTAENTDRLLERGARTYINSPPGAAFEGDILILSSIFDWYRSDFGEDEKQVLAFLSRFASPTLKARLAGHSGKIRYRYDWSLNDAAIR